jgi:hypothetical protein
MQFITDHSKTLEVVLLISVVLDVCFLGSTENVQTIFELLPSSVEHVRWNSRDRIPDTGLQVIKSVNWCSKHIALDITTQEKSSGVMSSERGGQGIGAVCCNFVESG